MTALVNALSGLFRFSSTLFHPDQVIGRLSVGLFRVARILVHPSELERLMSHGKIEKRRTELGVIYGPIDGILGWFAPLKNHVRIDILETVLLRAKDGTPEAIDRAITEVVAHEARHVWQYGKIGRWMIVDRWLITVGVTVVNQAWVYPAMMRVLGRFIDWLPLGWFGGIALLVSGVIIWVSLLIAAWVIGYYFSWAERDARKFAKEAIANPDWDQVVQVELGVPIHPFSALQELRGIDLPELDEFQQRRMR